MGFDENLRYFPFSIKAFVVAPDCNSFTNAELHIRDSIEDNLKIFFLISQRNVCLGETVLMMDHNIRFKGVRVLARNFKTCIRDSLLGIIWRPRMKNMRTGIRI